MSVPAWKRQPRSLAPGTTLWIQQENGGKWHRWAGSYYGYPCEWRAACRMSVFHAKQRSDTPEQSAACVQCWKTKPEEEG